MLFNQLIPLKPSPWPPTRTFCWLHVLPSADGTSGRVRCRLVKPASLVASLRSLSAAVDLYRASLDNITRRARDTSRKWNTVGLGAY